MYPTDQVLAQISQTGQMVSTIVNTATTLASPNMQIVSGQLYNRLIGTIRESRIVAMQEKVRVEAYCQHLLPAIVGGALTQEQAIAALPPYVQIINMTERRFTDIISALNALYAALNAIDNPALETNANAGNCLSRLTDSLHRLSQVCEFIRSHSRQTGTNMQYAQLVPDMPALTSRATMAGNMSQWLEQALELYASQLASL